jgi:hypothetical protein
LILREICHLLEGHAPQTQTKEDEMKFLKSTMVVFFALAAMIACSEKSPTTGQAEKKPEQPAVSQKAPGENPAAAVQSAELTGTVMTTDKGLALNTDSGLITITGEDLSAMVGKKVKVTGAITEGEGGKVIHVMTVTPVE